MRFLPFALFLLSATPNLLVAGDTCACGSTCTCKHENRGGAQRTEKIRKELASFYDAYWHGQDVNTNEYKALVYRAAAYGIDTGKLPPLPRPEPLRQLRRNQFSVMSEHDSCFGMLKL
jgi:hypothetical protein